MKKFEFAIIASGLDHDADDFEDAFYEAGCADATLSFQKGVIIVEFNRKSVSFSQAVISACQNVLKTGAKIERIEPDHLVSLTEISDRTSLTKQAISLYSCSKRGDDFPSPAAKITSKHPLYDWSEVAEWLYKNEKLSLEELVQARIVKEANVHFEANELPDDNFSRKLESLDTA